jgi:hypothetical protein
MKNIIISLITIMVLLHFSQTENQFWRNIPSEELINSGNFSCDGRIYCSQMTSCEEATFFLRNCPNVEMDGNNDGVPCEKQWCN